MPQQDKAGSVSECPKCGKEVQPTFKLCPYCGTELKAKEPEKKVVPPTKIECIKCGRELKPRFKFCPYCRAVQKPDDLEKELTLTPEAIVICVECSKPIKPRFKKCPYCGSPQAIKAIKVEKIEAPKEKLVVEAEPMGYETIEEYSANNVKSCKSCSRDIPATHRFCPYCGSMQ